MFDISLERFSKYSQREVAELRKSNVFNIVKDLHFESSHLIKLFSNNQNILSYSLAQRIYFTDKIIGQINYEITIENSDVSLEKIQQICIDYLSNKSAVVLELKRQVDQIENEFTSLKEDLNEQKWDLNLEKFVSDLLWVMLKASEEFKDKENIENILTLTLNAYRLLDLIKGSLTGIATARSKGIPIPLSAA